MAKKIQLKNEGSKYFVDLSGVMDEDLTYGDLRLDNPTELVVDFAKVISINSCGIREWIRWLSNFEKVKVTYKFCPKVIVDQINMVDGFLPKNGIVQSFYVPYYNDEAGTELQVLFNLGKEFDASGVRPPESVKDASGKPMEMDVIESKYFRFLAKLPKAA